MTEPTLFPLHQLITQVREELAEAARSNREAYARGTPPAVRFDIDDVEIEASVVLQTKEGSSGKGEVGVPKVLVLGVGASAEVSHQEVHKIKISLGKPQFHLGNDEVTGAPLYGDMPITSRGQDADQYGDR